MISYNSYIWLNEFFILERFQRKKGKTRCSQAQKVCISLVDQYVCPESKTKKRQDPNLGYDEIQD